VGRCSSVTTFSSQPALSATFCSVFRTQAWTAFLTNGLGVDSGGRICAGLAFVLLCGRDRHLWVPGRARSFSPSCAAPEYLQVSSYKRFSVLSMFMPITRRFRLRDGTRKRRISWRVAGDAWAKGEIRRKRNGVSLRKRSYGVEKKTLMARMAASARHLFSACALRRRARQRCRAAGNGEYGAWHGINERRAASLFGASP